MAHLFLIKNLDTRKIISIILFILTLFSGVVFYFMYLTGPLDYYSKDLTGVNIPSGSNVKEIAEILNEAGLIRHPSYFIMLSRIKRVDDKFKAGYYQFSKSMSMNRIIEKMIKGDVATFKLTVPEGLTVREIAVLVEEKIGIAREDFLRAAREYRLDFMPIQDVEFQVEGFLFPDTYYIPYQTSPRQLIDLMVKRFKKVVGTERVRVRGYILNTWELITIASLIEEEAKLDVDRAIISGVIYNRLERGMHLQLCASVLYVLGEKKERLSISDTRIDSPYNTYQNRGLPPGPISNPGLKSIKAALNPEDVPYYFYFALPDGTTYYSRTYDEHLEAINLYLD